ncbi:MAG: hypothetical protein P4L56_07085 [Candidatus Sulfopaludibacter sp.]|nr:hypothetical protein [Candidatus Sulfopaludibacter sp.]
MRRYRPVSVLLAACLAAPAWPHQPGGGCGSSRETLNESLFHHRQTVRARRAQGRVAIPSPANSDAGNIAVMQAVDGVVEPQNQFNLAGSTLIFTPVPGAATQYRYALTQQLNYNPAVSSPLAALGDDDSRLIPLPFTFPFFGAGYDGVYVNSDGNLTFTAGDSASTARSLGRMTAGPPRIAPLFDDLNPAQTAGGVQVLTTATAVVVSWVKVPEYASFGTGALQTFQVWLYPDGRIQFSYASVNPTSAVVGISPGNLQPGTALVDFLTDASAAYTATVAEIFGNTLTLDVVTIAQQFYQTHEDAYDYLAIYNNMGIAASGEGTVAYEETLRSSGSGYGVPQQDAGQQFGSAARLQAVLNLGPLSQYPADPNALVPARAPQADTPLTILTHEAGHLFLAFASIRSGTGLPMLGFQLAHWSFLFDSEASVMEGERIADRGSSTRPEFLTTDITQAYSPLDQYLMGFRSASEARDVFLVNNPSPNYAAAQHQLTGVGFDGTRQNISVNDVIAAEGRRTPDSTVAQRHFRFAFILVVAQGTQPSASDLSQVDTYRQQFETFYAGASSGRGVADTALRRSMELSLSPAGGAVVGRTARATLTVATPPAADVTVQLSAPEGHAEFPASVTIPAGSASVTFSFNGIRTGVEEVQATPSDAAYETAFARVQVSDSSNLQLVQMPGQATVRLTDANNLPYPGAGIVATPSLDGTVVPSEAFTDAQGVASFRWIPGPAPVNSLNLAVDGQPAASITLRAGSAVPAIASAVNAASMAAGIAPGSLALITGSNLTGAAVKLGATTIAPLTASASRILFLVPSDMTLGTTTLTVGQAVAPVSIAAAAPGIFAGGVVQVAGYLEIYSTGLGVTGAIPTVFIGATPVQPSYSGQAPGLAGVNQVNVQIPAGVARGLQPVVLSVDSVPSNSVNIMVQ